MAKNLEAVVKQLTRAVKTLDQAAEGIEDIGLTAESGRLDDMTTCIEGLRDTLDALV